VVVEGEQLPDEIIWIQLDDVYLEGVLPPTEPHPPYP